MYVFATKSEKCLLIAERVVALGAVMLLLVGTADVVLADQLGDTDDDCDVDVDDLNNLLNRFLETGDFDIDAVANLRKHFGAGELVRPPAPASGATLHLTPIVSSVFLPVEPFSEAVWEPYGSGALIAPGQGLVVAVVDLSMTIGDVQRSGAVGWGNVQFDVSIGGDAAEGFPDVPIGYISDIRTVDHDADPMTPELPLFFDNADFGASGDLMDIVAGVWPWRFGPEGIGPQRTLGQLGREKLGAVIVTVDSDTVGSSGSVEAIVKAFSTYDENLRMGRNDGRMIGGAASLSVPDTICTFGDTLPCDGKVDLNDLNGVRNGFGSLAPAPQIGEAYPFDGLIDIEDLMLVRNHFGEMHINLPVPEPASAMLAFTAVLCAWLCRRRLELPVQNM